MGFLSGPLEPKPATAAAGRLPSPTRGRRRLDGPGSRERRRGRQRGAGRRSTTGGRPAPGPASTAATWPPTPPRSRCSSPAGVGVLSRGVGPAPRRRRRGGGRRPARRLDQRVAGHPVVRHQPVRGRRRRGAGRPGGEPGLGRRASKRCAAAGPAATGPPSAPVRRRDAWASPWSALSGYPVAPARLEAVPGAGRGGPRPVRGGLRHARRLRRLPGRRPRRRGTTSAAMLVCHEAGAAGGRRPRPRPGRARPRRPAHPGGRGHPRAAGRRWSSPAARPG